MASIGRRGSKAAALPAVGEEIRNSYKKLIALGPSKRRQDKIAAICKDDAARLSTDERWKKLPHWVDADGRKQIMNVRRRTVLQGMLGASALVAAPAILRAQSGPMKIGFLTVKTGPLAAGGIQMEQGLTLYLKERNNTLAGRPVQRLHRRFRRRAGGGAHQDAGVRGEGKHRLPDRAAGNRRGARDRRLHPRQADPRRSASLLPRT